MPLAGCETDLYVRLLTCKDVSCLAAGRDYSTDFWLSAIQTCGQVQALQYASATVRSDRNLAIRLTSQLKSMDEVTLFVSEYMESKLRSDIGVMLKIVEAYPSLFEYAADEIKCDTNKMIQFIRVSLEHLHHAASSLKQDPIFWIEAIKVNGQALRYAGEFRAHRGVVVAAADYYCRSAWPNDFLHYMSPQLKFDKESILDLVKVDGLALRFAGHTPKPHVVSIEAWTGDLVDKIIFKLSDGSEQHYGTQGGSRAEDFVLGDAEFITEVQQRSDSVSLNCISFRTNTGRCQFYGRACDGIPRPSWRAEPGQHIMGLVRAAEGWCPPLTGVVEADVEPIEATGTFECDKDVVLAAVRKNGLALQFAGPLRADRQVVNEACSSRPWAIEHAAESIRADLDFMLALIQSRKNGVLFKVAAGSLKTSKEAALAVCSVAGNALFTFSKELQTDKDVVLAALRTDKHAGIGLPYWSEKEFVLQALKMQPGRFESVASSLQGDLDVRNAAGITGEPEKPTEDMEDMMEDTKHMMEDMERMHMHMGGKGCDW